MADDQRLSGEDGIVQEFLAPLTRAYPDAFGLQDDCALIHPKPGTELVVKTDPVIAGVHFLPSERPSTVAWKALAVNVSDLVAKGALPQVYVMALALPEAPQRRWMEEFAAGLKEAQEYFGCVLIGGDTDRTPGPLSVSITIVGVVPAGRMVHRHTANPGDRLFVSGTIGDAVLGLKLQRTPDRAAAWGLDPAMAIELDGRLRRPSPRLDVAALLRSHAAAAIDISDGLVKDFRRLCSASRTGGRIAAVEVPMSAAAHAVLAAGGATLEQLLTGGEDYEVLTAVRQANVPAFLRAAAAAKIVMTRIGEVLPPADGVAILGPDGQPMEFAKDGWEHF